MEKITFSEFYESFDFKSDKGTTHDYINGYYSNEFTPIRNNKLKILEIGVHRGSSMKLLRDWFINSEITGIDPFGDGLPEGIADEIRKMGDITIIQDDGYTQKILDIFEDNSLDYIIDDGPHTLDSQIYSLRKWYKKVKTGGKLIIEDIQSLTALNALVIEANHLDYEYTVFDFRQNKGRYDDIILEIIKK
jgi:hypothetical protein